MLIEGLKEDSEPLSNTLKRVLATATNLDWSDWERSGDTPLIMAAYVGAHQAAKLLLDRGADVDARDIG